MSFTVDGQLRSSTNPVGEVRKPDLRVKLLRLYTLFATLVLLGVIFLGLFIRSRLENESRATNLVVTQALAQQLDPKIDPLQLKEEMAPWLSVIAGEGPLAAFIVDPSQDVVAAFEQNMAFDTDGSLRSWQRTAWRTAHLDGDGSFITTAPDGQDWLYSYARLPQSTYSLIIEQPGAVAFATSQLFTLVLIGAVLIFSAGGIFSWIVLSNMLIKPLEDLVTYSERIRWRGQLSATEQGRINTLAQREDQLGDLTRSLQEMQVETEKRLVQLATLLKTSRIVASSLESREVIDNIFDQVEKLFAVSRSAVVVLDQRAGVFRIRASRGLSANYVSQLRIAPSEPNSPSMRALRNQTPIQVADTETDLAFIHLRERSRSEGFRSVLAIPLQTQHAPPAVLLLYRAVPYRYSFSEIELATSFGHHASIALENAALFAKTDERLQEQTRQLEAIVESLNDGLILESLSGEVLFYNQRVLAWLGLSHGQAKNKSSTELLELLLRKVVNADEIRQELRASPDQIQNLTFDLSLDAQHNLARYLRIHHFDVTDVQGELLGRGQLWQDITQDKEVDRMKSALLSTVSHELRTPLATIKGFASTLLAEDVEWEAAAQREFLEAISNESDRLTRLVQNLLDMSRIEAGMLTIQCELYSLNDLLAEVVQSFSATHNGRIRTHPTPDLPPVWMDIPRIGTVIRNLIENAIKYSPLDSTVDISTFRQNNTVVLAARDRGPGIPAEFHDKVFDRFFRVENGLLRRVGGSGLGLAISQGFIDAHHGQIWVTDADPGALFAFSLPIDRLHGEG